MDNRALKAGILFIFANLGGVETWFPLNRPQAHYIHSQGAPAMEWTIYHNLGSKEVVVTVYNDDDEIIDVYVQHKETPEDGWHTTVRLAEAGTGYAVIFGRENLTTPTINTQVMHVTNELTIQGNTAMTDSDIQAVLDGMTTTFQAHT